MRYGFVALLLLFLGVAPNMAMGASYTAVNDPSDGVYEDEDDKKDVNDGVKDTDAYLPNAFYLGKNNELANEVMEDTRDEDSENSEDESEDAYDPNSSGWPK